MISFSKLGRLGRLGNQLFQIASMHGIAKKLGTTAHFPNWEYSKYFTHDLPKLVRRLQENNEPCFHYSDEWLKDERDYIGWLQSDKYFESREAVKKLFTFQKTFRDLVAAKYATYLSRETICISIRRGDFVGNENYELIPAKFYIGALLQFDYKDCNILFFSDDITYCETHFQCLPNAYFIEADPIEQLCLMTMCDNHIISNSTFSWWGAYLSDSKRVVRPAYNFSQSYLKKYTDKDYWVEGWEIFDHKDYKIPLDCTFIIPVQYDHQDRADNLRLNLLCLEDLDCNIIIGENGPKHFTHKQTKQRFDFNKFHRTKMINELTRSSGTEIVCNWDADVICPPMQLYLAVEAIKEGSDIVYPYDGRFARVPRKHYNDVLRYGDIGILSKFNFRGMNEADTRSVGGAVMYNKKRFFEAGGENERMVSYAPEDLERFYRFKAMGLKIERIEGVIYHMDHFIGVNSFIRHPDYRDNYREWEKIKVMDNLELKKYVASWEWL